MVVSTVMANMGLERYLVDLGIELIRTPVGDGLMFDIDFLIFGILSWLEI